MPLPAEASVIRFPDGGPHPPIHGADGSIRTRPSFDAATLGMGDEFLTSAFDPHKLFNLQRVAELAFRESYFRCVQHDHKVYDFDGRMMTPDGWRSTQPLIGGSMPEQYVSLKDRRPSMPYRLARKIVRAFTELLFTHGRFPQFRSRDERTQAFAEALSKAANLPLVFDHARDVGGACGTVGISWRWVDGLPRCKVHLGRNIHVVAWRDRDEWLPEHVVELYKFDRLTHDEEGNLVMAPHWYRCDWTPRADVVFYPEPVRDEPPQWRVDEEATEIHDEGEPRFVYLVNVQPFDPSDVDGEPDYHENYEALSGIDTLNSVLHKGTALNLDPTLKLKMEREQVGGALVKKGSENALVVGENGDAAYLTLGAETVQAGKELFNLERAQILETCEVVVPEPETIAASQMSAVALRVVYAPMLSAADKRRQQYGDRGLLRLVRQMINSARRMLSEPISVPVYDDHGNAVGVEEAEVEIRLPDREVQEPELDAEGAPTGRVNVRFVPQDPGEGDVTLEWGDYFEPTGDDKQKATQAVSQAVGGRPVLSQKTGVEIVANLYDRDANQEWEAVSAEEKARVERELGMFPPIGGGESVDVDAHPIGPAGSALAGVNVQQTVLNGAQITALIEVVQSVVEGRVPRASGVEILVVALGLPRESAEQLIGAAGAGFRQSSIPEQT